MDSKRALRSTLVTLLSFAGATGGSTAAASADTEVEHRGFWRTSVETPDVRRGTWSTKARPKTTPRRPEGRNKRIALGLVVQRAWSLREFQCLDSLWTRESNWNHRAYNRSSGAYGIPQALPGGKMRGAGHDWRYNPATQIRWGLKYIKGRYGRPCGAWGHFRSHNWY
ncbi:transglycosylase SLT domain-containing protein [Nonomuraea sp. NPDC050547]|uniref:aggregation-promoting factor C-terminal-like domain-containing protein n=1 Tax=unclassified Nonomuraea TaxID=2593643 RepID=UPI0034905492